MPHVCVCLKVSDALRHVHPTHCTSHIAPRAHIVPHTLHLTYAYQARAMMSKEVIADISVDMQTVVIYYLCFFFKPRWRTPPPPPR